MKNRKRILALVLTALGTLGAVGGINAAQARSSQPSTPQTAPSAEADEAKGTEGDEDAAAQHAACQKAGIDDTATPNVQYDDQTGACSLDTDSGSQEEDN